MFCFVLFFIFMGGRKKRERERELEGAPTYTNDTYTDCIAIEINIKRVIKFRKSIAIYSIWCDRLRVLFFFVAISTFIAFYFHFQIVFSLIFDVISLGALEYVLFDFSTFFYGFCVCILLVMRASGALFFSSELCIATASWMYY